MKMPFGKHKSVEIEDVPKSYLRWLIKNVPLRGNLLQEVETALQMRTKPNMNVDVDQAISTKVITYDQFLQELENIDHQNK